jgi:hypothetical protein
MPKTLTLNFGDISFKMAWLGKKGLGWQKFSLDKLKPWLSCVAYDSITDCNCCDDDENA